MPHKNVRGVRTKTHKEKKGGKGKVREMMFHEVFSNPPAVVEQTERKKGAKAALAQKRAIALSKTRRYKG